MDDFDGRLSSLHNHGLLRSGIRGLPVLQAWLGQISWLPDDGDKSPLRSPSVERKDGSLFRRRSYSDGGTKGGLADGLKFDGARGTGRFR